MRAACCRGSADDASLVVSPHPRFCLSMMEIVRHGSLLVAELRRTRNLAPSQSSSLAPRLEEAYHARAAADKCVPHRIFGGMEDGPRHLFGCIDVAETWPPDRGDPERAGALGSRSKRA
jgi:hypothetical protein